MSLSKILRAEPLAERVDKCVRCHLCVEALWLVEWLMPFAAVVRMRSRMLSAYASA